jgi:hypothetical protein
MDLNFVHNMLENLSDKNKTLLNIDLILKIQTGLKDNFCAIVLYLLVYHVCFQDGKLCLRVANDKLDGKYFLVF